MGALCSKYNDAPETASRPYSKDNDGFVIAGGGGMVVLESLSHAQKRGAKILAEVVGYAANSDGVDMVAPSGEGRLVASNWHSQKPSKTALTPSTISTHMALQRRQGTFPNYWP